MRKLLLVGDTHGNAGWFNASVAMTAIKTSADLVLQVGDFGYWPHDHQEPAIMAATERLFTRAGIPTWFIDGNHENHQALQAAVKDALAAAGRPDYLGPTPLTESTSYLPRGSRFEFEGCSLAFMGGAHSIDRARRTPGFDWFPEEYVTETELERLEPGGPADILIVHDTPSGYMIPGVDNREVRGPWLDELTSCANHRWMIRRAMEIVQPRLIVHGHYHQHYTQLITEPWGTVTILGLAADGDPGAMALLTLTDGEIRLEDVKASE